MVRSIVFSFWCICLEIMQLSVWLKITHWKSVFKLYYLGPLQWHWHWYIYYIISSQNCFSSCRGRKVAKKKATRKMLTKHKGGKLLNRSANCGAAEGTQPQLVMVYGGGAAAGHCTVHRLRLSFVTISSLPTAAHWAHSGDRSSHLTCLVI